MGFTVPSYKKATPTEYETFYKDAFEIFQSEVIRLQFKGYKYAERGKDSLANKSYKAANMYYYLMYVLLAAYEKQKYLLAAGEVCIGKILNETYGFDCIEERLPCLSSDFGTNYVSAWKSMFTHFGIDNVRICEEDAECGCVGIGLMVVDPSTCPFEVGPGDCPVEEVVSPQCNLGEFAACEFVTHEIIWGDVSNETCEPIVYNDERNECN